MGSDRLVTLGILIVVFIVFIVRLYLNILAEDIKEENEKLDKAERHKRIW